MCYIQLNCPAALERIKEGRPITIKDENKGTVSRCIADIVSVRDHHFFVARMLVT